MERWSGAVAIVTGASSGIGAAIACDLALAGLRCHHLKLARNLKVVGLARRVEKIEELTLTLREAPGELIGLKCDMSDESEILDAFKWATTYVGPISILVNNAGLVTGTTLIDGCTADWRRTFDVNVLALCICTREAIRSMTQHGIAGHVVHINSITGHYPVPMPDPIMNVYPASKYAVTALTETLRHELRARKLPIRVTGISPGIVLTELFENCKEGVKEGLEAGPALRPEDVSRAVLYALSVDANVQVHELMMHPLFEPI